MTDEAIGRLAARLAAAEQTRVPCAPLRDEIAALAGARAPAEIAYAIQARQTDGRVAAGQRITGRKIGLTSKAVQAQLGVDAPDFGTLFDVMAVGDGEAIALEKLIQPKVEAEIALVLERDLACERHTTADILRATAFAVAAIEVVDSRVEGWNIRLTDTVADNGSSARYVLGTCPVSLSRLDLVDCVMEMETGGAAVSRGQGAACLGNPINAAIWLADTMAAAGTPLRAGDVVLTGALGPMAVVSQPGTFTARISGLGGVRAAFSRTTFSKE